MFYSTEIFFICEILQNKLFYVNFIVIIPNVPTVKDLHIRILGNPDWNSTKCMRVYFIIGYFNIKNYVIDDSVTFISADQKEKK